MNPLALALIIGGVIIGGVILAAMYEVAPAVWLATVEGRGL